jgi:flagella basal body P-ring formation protein FlgA
VRRFGSLGLFLAIFLLLGTVPAVHAAPDVVFQEETTVTHGPLTLSGLIVEDGSESSYSLELGELPGPGETKIISRAYVQMTARRNDVEPPNFVGGPVRVQVKRPERIVKGDDLKDRVIETVMEAFALPDETDVTVRNLPDEVTILPGPYDLSVRSRNTSYQSRRGNLRHRFDVLQKEERITTFRAEVEVTQSDRVAFAKRPLNRETVIQPEMITWKEKDIGTGRGGLVQEAEQLIGKKLNRSLRAGKPFQREYLEEPIVVERRDLITIRYQVGNMRITTRGEAQEEGSIGEQIQVENLSTEQTVTAQIINENIVETSRN